MVTMIIPRLPCIVDRLEGFVMLWKKNGEIITVASQIIDKVINVIIIIIMMKDHDDHNDNDACDKVIIMIIMVTTMVTTMMVIMKLVKKYVKMKTNGKIMTNMVSVCVLIDRVIFL